MQIWLTWWVSQSVQRSTNFCLKPYLISCYRRAESPRVRIKGQTISGWWLSHGIILSYLKLIRSDAPGIMRIHKITRRPRVTGIWSSKSHYVDLRPSASLIRSQWHSSPCLPTVNLFQSMSSNSKSILEKEMMVVKQTLQSNYNLFHKQTGISVWRPLLISCMCK